MFNRHTIHTTCMHSLALSHSVPNNTGFSFTHWQAMATRSAAQLHERVKIAMRGAWLVGDAKNKWDAVRHTVVAAACLGLDAANDDVPVALSPDDRACRAAGIKCIYVLSGARAI